MYKFKHFSTDGMKQMEKEMDKWFLENPTIEVVSHAHTRISQNFVVVSIIYTYE